MGTATQLIGLEQRPIFRGDQIVPDFIGRFKPSAYVLGESNDKFNEFSCVIEVKSTSEDKFKIGGSRLRRIRNFAEKMKLPLIFAVRFTQVNNSAFWVIVEDDQRKSTLKAEVGDAIKGIRHVLWDEYGLFIHPQFSIVAVYDPKSTDNGVRHKEYGILRKLIIRTGNKSLIYTGNEANMFLAFFEAYEMKEVQVEKREGFFLQVSHPEMAMCFLSDFVFRVNRLFRYDNGNLIYDAPKILARADLNPKLSLIDRTIIENIENIFIRENILFVMGMGDEKDHRTKWERLGRI